MTNQQPIEGAPSTAAAKKGNGLGVAALVVGIVGFVLSWIPFACYGGIALDAIALILGIVALILTGRSKGTAIAGVVIAAVGVIGAVIMIVLTAGLVAGVSKAVSDLSTSAAQDLSTAGANDLSGTHTIQYDATGTASGVTILYSTWTGTNVGSSTATDQALPWTNTQQATGLLTSGVLSVTAGADGGTVECKITIDGKVVSDNTANGPFASAACTASSF